MTPRERIRAVLRHQQPDRVPRMTNFYPTAFGPHPGRPREVEFETDIRFVALPEPEEQVEFMRYLERVRSRGLAAVLDYRRPEFLAREDFADAGHLRSRGALVYSRRLAEDLAGILTGLAVPHTDR